MCVRRLKRNINHKSPYSLINGCSQRGFQMSVRQLLSKKRDGEEFTKDEIYSLVCNIVAGNFAESQIGAMLMAMYLQGLSDVEAVHLTQSMVLSGDQLQWKPEWEGILVDKHSTGGVGDKISLILAPVLAACDLKVPMISGRSLEHTGGTLDKLESIPGFTVDLDHEQMMKALEHAGCFIVATTDKLCPADKILYRVRDITSTVDHINLIVPSIISKKVASGTRNLVIDVKVGAAAFCKTIEKARALAKQLINVSAKLGVCTRAILSRMDEPLGRSAGNTLEVVETVQSLSGHMSPDVARLVYVLGANLLEMTGYKGDAEQLIRKVICNGSAMERFQRMLLAQGVDEETLNRLVQGKPVLPTAKYTTQITALTSGWVAKVDAWIIGQVCLKLGAGRQGEEDVIDPTVGVEISKHQGDRVAEGENWVTVHHSSPSLPSETIAYLQQALTVVPTKVERSEVVIEVVQ